MKPLLELSELHEFVSGLDHSEGICFAPNGKIYMGGESGQVYEVGDDRELKIIANTNGFLLGLAADAHNRLYLCDTVAKKVLRLNEDNSLTTFAEHPELFLPNWGAFSPDGNYYFSDSGHWGQSDGKIFRVKDGITEVWSEESKNFPNGLTISAGGDSLLILESYPSSLVEIQILPDGSPGKRRVICEMGEIVPDGIALMDDGRFLVSCYRPDSIFIINPNGEITLLADDPRGTVIAGPTNVVFFGENLERVLVPNIGRWHATEFEIPGVKGIPLFYPNKDLIGS
jgi:gluconolactonase